MKRILLMAAAATLALASCDKDNFNYDRGDGSATGTLSFASFSLDISEDTDKVDSRAASADGTYAVYIDDEEGVRHLSTTYGELTAAGNTVQLPAGKYTLTAQSRSEVPTADFEMPVYGASHAFTIEAGKTTELGAMTCTLLQCKVSVGYNEDFLAMVTGDCATSVELTQGSPLEYAMTKGDGGITYEKRNGYFAVNGGTTLIVTFRGQIEGKMQRMTKSFTGIAPRQWRQITFVQKINDEGDATFDISISDYVEDETLGNDVAGNETILGDDPQAPAGDGGIKLESTCAYDISQPITVPAEGEFVLTMKAAVPAGVRRFTVDIVSTNPDFPSAVASINGGSTTLDLVEPSEGAMDVFTNLIPFPYGDAVKGKTEIDFDLSKAQGPISAFKGEHTFMMQVTDNNGARKQIPVTMVVK